MAKRKRNFIFTLNNFTEKDIKLLLTQQHTYFSEEIGESGTPHLQGFLMYDNARSFKQIQKLIPRAHIEIMRGTKQENLNYCSKQEGTFHTNMHFKKKIINKLDKLKLYEWQTEIIDIIKTEPHGRIIHWDWESKGKAGRRALARHMISRHNALVVGGKETDNKYGITEWMEKKELTTIIIDIPRCSYDNISYKAIEQIKNGFFYNTKYKSGMCVFNPPHVIVFANSEPQYKMMSEDRWKVMKIS